MYNTIRIHFIPDVSHFLNVIDSCEKPVLFDYSEKELCDLRKDEKTREILRTLNGNRFYGMMTLRADSADALTILGYMQNMALA